METESLRTISRNIRVIPAGNDPLSADVGIVYGMERIYLYDVGADERSRRLINGLPGKKSVVLSHFHQDHTGNLPYIEYDTLYGGRESINHLPKNADSAQSMGETGHCLAKENICVTETICIDDGVHIEIIPFPSTHAKGSMIMCVDEEYAFLGDGIYTAMISGRPCYNVQLLKAGIDILKTMNCRCFILSHDLQLIHEKQEILEFLMGRYEKRKKNEAYIDAGDFL